MKTTVVKFKIEYAVKLCEKYISRIEQDIQETLHDHKINIFGVEDNNMIIY